MKVLFCASEVAPFAKTGGLADVAGTLPLALGNLGVDVMIVMPRYRGLAAGVTKLSKHVSICFIENEAYFNRASLYGNASGDYPDNLKRFSFFCHELFLTAQQHGFKPEIIHLNDWQTALVAVLLKTRYVSDSFFKGTKSLLTIHNLAYQGHFPHRQYADMGVDPSLFSMEGFEFYGKINVLKAGLLFADAINTVSPNYAREIMTKEYGFGLEGVIRKRKDRVHGILNGIDESLWNPEEDSNIKKKFSSRSPAGKKICKADLQLQVGLEVREDVPLFAMVTRLAEQKGLDLLLESMDSFFKKDVQFVLLGEGDGVYQTAFRNIGMRYPKKAAVQIGYDTAQAHRIYAGADFFLMPSLFEPCGLGQMISLRYGTLPIVRHTGGLTDTVVDIDADSKRGNGFVFEHHKPQELLGALKRAIAFYHTSPRREALKKTVMKGCFSWEKSAAEYKKLYREIME